MKSYELTQEEKSILNPSQVETYERAIRFCNNEDAGGYNGWAAGHALLISLGWEKVERTEGHRTFVRLEKPSILKTYAPTTLTEEK